MSNRKATVFFCVFVLGLYAAGYAAARKGGWIVHRAGFYTDSEQKQRVAGHAIVEGDFGVPALAPKMSALQSVVAAAYLPLREMETVVWKQRVPPGSEWPTHWKLEQSNQ